MSDSRARPDSPDILVVELVLEKRNIILINLYNDCETRAGVALLRSVLVRLGPKREKLALMDSNSHHFLWDSKFRTRTRDEDDELHDLLIGHPLIHITPPDVPTHLPSGNVLDLGFASPSLVFNIRNVQVNSDLGLGSDHLPITYELELSPEKLTSNRFNPKEMNLDKFLAVLKHELGVPVNSINNQVELDAATNLLCDALVVALNASTPKRRPSSHSKSWWTTELSQLLARLRYCTRWFQRHRVPSARLAFLEARRNLYLAIAEAKEGAWREFIANLDRGNVYDVLERMRRRPRTVFPSLVDPSSGETAVDLEARGRVLGRSWFGSSAVEVEKGAGGEDASGHGERGNKDSESNKNENNNNNNNENNNENNDNNSNINNVQEQRDERENDSVGSSDDGKGDSGEKRDGEEERAEKRARIVAGLVIVDEREWVEVTDSEVDAAVWAGDAWKAPDTHGIQLGFIRKGWPVLADHVRVVFKSSVRLGLYPTRLKTSNAIPTPKAGKKDKTSPKAYRPVEQHAEALAKPLERLVANRIIYDAEKLGKLHEGQFGARPGRSTQQAADALIHRVRALLDKGMVVSTIYLDLKGAFNGVAHIVVARMLAEEGYSRRTIAWVLSFLDGHLVTIVLDGKRTVTFRITDKGAPQGSALSVIIFLLVINRLLRRLSALNIPISWQGGFVDDISMSTASRSVLENVQNLEAAGREAKAWEADDEATFESDKTDLIHFSAGRADLSQVTVDFGGTKVFPAKSVKWIGLVLDSALSGREHIAARATSAYRALNASVAVMSKSWGLQPQLLRDLARSTVLPCGDYGVSSFLPLPTSTFKPLDKINKAVARCITGSFRTVSLAALEKEAAILPAQLRIERDAMNTVAYYLTLPPSHCIRPLLLDAISSPPKHPKFASILHYVERIPGIRWPDTVPARGQRLRPRGSPRVVLATELPNAPFDSSLGMEPILPVYAAPWAPPLPVTTAILPQEEALQALEVALSDERRRSATWYTDGSLLDGRAGGAAVRVEDGVEKETVVVPLGDSQVCDGEMEGLVCSTSRSLKAGCTCILCVADSQAALRGILCTKPRSGQYRAIMYDKMVREVLLLYPHLTILNLWTPAHIGTAGNELADAAAKEATLAEPDPSLYVSLTSVRRHIHLLSLQRWDDRWKASKTGKALRAIDDSPVSLRLIPLYSTPSLPRKTSSSISQLRTGFTFLNADRFKSGFVSSPACDECGAGHETRSHFILGCPAWEHLRQPLYETSRAVGIMGSLHLAPLLSHPKLLKGTAKFVEATGRLT